MSKTQTSEMQVPNLHYHVTSGLAGGYMPNTNEVYRSQAEARNGLKWLVDQLRGNEPWHLRSDSEIFYGNLKAGVFNSKDGSYYAMIETCYESECMHELNQEEAEGYTIQEQEHMFKSLKYAEEVEHQHEE